MTHSLSAEAFGSVRARLREANASLAARYPGESGRRQPVHTVYGGAHLFKADSAPKLGSLALGALAEYAPDSATLAAALDLTDPPTTGGREPLSRTLYARVVEKLRREPVEDFRIDFEDGYGNRPEAEEDGHAEAAAREVAEGMKAGSLPPFIGIRIKPFSEELADRGARTLDIFTTTLARATGGRLPDNFVVTLPKVTHPAQPAALADLFELLERALPLAGGALRLELMIETTQAILNERGESALPGLIHAARGRAVAAHFGTYDYTAACNITAAYQVMTHPACDFAKQMMQVALAGTGIWLSDGGTNVMPVAPHRSSTRLTAPEQQQNRAAVHRAWKLHYDHIRHSLATGYYQGWDLHPAQLPTRYAAVYAFFLEGLDAASERLRNFVGKAAQATLSGEVFDDAATGQGLLNYFLRAVNCGAITEREALDKSGLTIEELRGRSFVRILRSRRR